MKNKKTGITAAKIQRVITRFSLNGPANPIQNAIRMPRMRAYITRNKNPKNERFPKLDPWANSCMKKYRNIKTNRPLNARGTMGL